MSLHGRHVVGFEPVFEYGSISALFSAVFVSMCEGKEPAISFHKRFLAMALYSASFLQLPPEFQKVPICMHEQQLLLQEGIFTHVCLSVSLAQWIALSEFTPMEYLTCFTLDTPGP